MRTVIEAHELLPKSLQPQSLFIETGRARIRASSGSKSCICSCCGRSSSRAHRRYSRTVSGLPWHGISVTLEVHARRFFGEEALCEQRIPMAYEQSVPFGQLYDRPPDSGPPDSAEGLSPSTMPVLS